MADETEQPEILKHEFKSNAADVAECGDIELRANSTFRLVMRAKLVENPKEPGAGVRFWFIHQRKRPSETWEDVDAKKATSLKADEGVAIELTSEETYNLAQHLCDLQAIKDQFGVPDDNTYFIGVRRPPVWGTVFGGHTGPKLIPAKGTSDEVSEALRLLFMRDDLGDLAAVINSLSPEKVGALRAKIGLSALDQLLKEWDEDPTNPSEEHWQCLFEKYPFALEQIFHVPTVVFESKAYVGGKAFDNSGGKLVDFLLETEKTHASVIVEIKTPQTQLLYPTPYRGNAYRPYKDLSGSVVQALTYRDTWLESLGGPLGKDTGLQSRILPKCAVIIGDSAELDADDKTQSFERYRARPDVHVLTFDEVRERLVRLKKVMESVAANEVSTSEPEEIF